MEQPMTRAVSLASGLKRQICGYAEFFNSVGAKALSSVQFFEQADLLPRRPFQSEMMLFYKARLASSIMKLMQERDSPQVSLLPKASTYTRAL